MHTARALKCTVSRHASIISHIRSPVFERAFMVRNSSPISRRLAIASAVYRPCLSARLFPFGAPGDGPPCIRHPTVRHINRTISHAFCGPACGLHSLMLDVPLHPFLLGKRLVRDGVISIDVFSSINPQAGKLCHCRQRRDNGTMLSVTQGAGAGAFF
jgi:hypothetical protein